MNQTTRAYREMSVAEFEKFWDDAIERVTMPTSAIGFNFTNANGGTVKVWATPRAIRELEGE